MRLTLSTGHQCVSVKIRQYTVRELAAPFERKGVMGMNQKLVLDVLPDIVIPEESDSSASISM
jgi:hypothetical protein